MPSKSSLNASLTPELAAFVAAKVQSGDYRSASEVVRAALRLLAAQDRRVTRTPDKHDPDRQHAR